MNYEIKQIEGIGSIYGERLNQQNIFNTNDLLNKAGTKNGRKHLAEDTEIPESLILTWVNHADLMRIEGIAGHFSELLEASGVDTVKEFALRNPENLHAKMIEVNNEFGLAGKVPSVQTLIHLIDQAKKLEQKVFH